MKALIFYIPLLLGFNLTAQVGIGNTNPKAELDISSAQIRILALRLRAQINPAVVLWVKWRK